MTDTDTDTSISTEAALDTHPDLRAFGKPVVFAEVDISAASSTRCLIAAAVLTDVVLPVGALTFDPARGVVEIVVVTDRFQRRGVATTLWGHARRLCPQLAHSTTRSAAGTAWATAVGGDVPPVRQRLSAREGIAHGAGLMMHLHGFTPADLIPIGQAN